MVWGIKDEYVYGKSYKPKTETRKRLRNKKGAGDTQLCALARQRHPQKQQH
jgi:hypothetical protein